VTDKRLEGIVARLLQTGVLVSATVVLAGGVWFLSQNGGARPQYQQFRPPDVVLRSPAKLIRGLAHPDPASVIQLGLLILIATPVARVAFSLVAFALERDRLYVLITLIVFAVLIYSVAVAH